MYVHKHAQWSTYMQPVSISWPFIDIGEVEWHQNILTEYEHNTYYQCTIL